MNRAIEKTERRQERTKWDGQPEKHQQTGYRSLWTSEVNDLSWRSSTDCGLNISLINSANIAFLLGKKSHLNKQCPERSVVTNRYINLFSLTYK